MLSALAFCLAGNTYPDLDYSRHHKNRILWELFYYTLFWRNTVYWTTEHISTFAVKARWLSRAFHSVAGLMRALMHYYTYSMRCNWWFWEKPLGIFKFSVSSFNFCVCRSVKIQIVMIIMSCTWFWQHPALSILKLLWLKYALHNDQIIIIIIYLLLS